jgi:hypothetical protein
MDLAVTDNPCGLAAAGTAARYLAARRSWGAR